MAGTAHIEIWGAGGSGARMCCCGDGLLGNAGGYAYKKITVEADDTLTGCTGMPVTHTALSFKVVPIPQVFVG